eukprot:CAMPEP_0198723404 /NCGR_PEP_ID=MMETSP1475-20131203/911_1 /TAXON_ID= ORGANISM="Unidentified sp., Strain CCMP1999" /NCGR_SAMPLE_ID=MMETSP1475 /ASSEMBLY_ACC=CAM_ASM_001111 /LENGTH=410 /DNA_ID=CAMNT_0044484515 /DNA_START=9 /DNA_END=1241 /DNA_ORIENTATION=-
MSGAHRGETPPRSSSQTVFQRVVLITVLILASWMFSGSLVIYNKWLLRVCDEKSPANCRGWGFPFPIFVTFSHMVIIFVVLGLVIHVFKLVEKPVCDRHTYWYKVVPYGTLVALDIGLSNLGFVFLEATFEEMCKSSMPAIVMVLSIAAGLETASLVLAGQILLICVGLVVSSVGEANFSWTGFIIVMISVLMGATKLVISQWLIQGIDSPPPANSAEAHLHDGQEEDDSEISAHETVAQKPLSDSSSAKSKVFNGLSSVQILYLQTPISAILLLIPALISLYVRLPRVSFPDSSTYFIHTVFIVLGGGGLALFLDMFNLLVVQYTSALSLTVSGVAKTSVIILASWLFFRNDVTRMTVLGYLICLSGVVLYNINKYRKLKATVLTPAYDVVATEELPDISIDGSGQVKA